MNEPWHDDAVGLLRGTARRLDYAGLLLTGGNVSVRTGAASYLITPTGFAVNDYAATGQLSPVEVQVESDAPERASSETPLHSAIYRRFPEFGGICHIHSAAIIALGLPETWPTLTTTILKCFPVHVASGHSRELASASQSLLQRSDEDLLGPYGFTLLVPGHGLFTAGPTVQRAAHMVLRVHENALVAAYRGQGK